MLPLAQSALAGTGLRPDQVEQITKSLPPQDGERR